MPKLILCRHGQSEWNAKNLLPVGKMFNCQNKGRNEAITSGKN